MLPVPKRKPERFPVPALFSEAISWEVYPFIPFLPESWKWKKFPNFSLASLTFCYLCPFWIWFDFESNSLFKCWTFSVPFGTEQFCRQSRKFNLGETPIFHWTLNVNCEAGCRLHQLSFPISSDNFGLILKNVRSVQDLLNHQQYPITHRIHVWYICLHLVDFCGTNDQCR